MTTSEISRADAGSATSFEASFTFQFWCGDVPYVDIRCNGMHLFHRFHKKVVLHTPTSSTCLNDPDKEDIVDYPVRDWSWWLEFPEDGCEISCSYSICYGNRLAVSGPNAHEFSVPVSTKDARALRKALDGEFAQKHVREFLSKAKPSVYTPMGVCSRYPASTTKLAFSREN